jgi:outer membrane protein TolC
MRPFWALIFILACGHPAPAQLSLAGAVDLALRGNPRVQGAQADVDRAHAQVSEALDAYVPAVTAGAGIGQAYGYLPYPPTLFQVNGGSLVFNISQFAYIHSARVGLDAAQLELQDIREAVAEDTALAFVALSHDQLREQVIGQQAGFANTLVAIVQQRVDAGQDTQIELTQAKLTAAQLRLASLKQQDETAVDREHLARLIALPVASLSIDGSFPAGPVPLDTTVDTTVHGYANPAVASLFANAEAKRLQAKGDSHYLFWPRINLFSQYNRYATFTDSFAALQKLNPGLTAEEGAFGVQINIPVMDKSSGAKARESAAEAARALHDAQNAQLDALDGQSRLRRSIVELQAQADVATLRQQLAQQQLDVLHLQLQSGSPDGAQKTPKDEQNARIDERDKYLAVIDAGFQLRQAEIHLLRQTGGLEAWLKSSASTAAPTAPTPQN